MAATHSEFDTYGFERPDDFDYKTYQDFMSSYLRVLARRAAKWDVMVKNKERVKKSVKVKRYVRKGIPNEHRPMVWMCVSGAQERMEANPDLFQKLLSGPKDQQLMETIQMDLYRTFPENIFFKDLKDPKSLRGHLQNVLVAFGHHNKSIGYCQGLNFIAALMLLVVRDDHKVFWLLDTIVTNILPDYYARDMVGLKTDQEVLGELIKLKVPNVHAKITGEGIHWSLICTKWFICLFADVLPVESVLRIWDSLLFEGSKVLFRISLTLVKLHEEKLLKCKNFPEITEIFKGMTQDKIAFNCHDLMQNSFILPGSLPQSLINKLREKHRRVIEEE
ncbi:growth hormone-regulated TBC protein 1-A-like isoform X2 [Lineus longissimus]|uniref:growth hormone-regulated TBC protein 1-A-like isoform X2 n=1 Tax=Lineus longissimus TaxID=88925 RepID=UPI002B4FB37C